MLATGTSRGLSVLFTVGLTLSTATAQYQSGFETLTALPGGSLLTGQDGYLNPVAGSADFNAYTYAGNTLGVANHPGASAQFVAGFSAGGAAVARAQRNISFVANKGVWTMGTDILGKYNGTLPTAQNLASLSLQPSTTNRSFIMLATWVDVNTAASWNANLSYFTAANAAGQTIIPNPAFQNLPANNWYRWETDWSFETNLIIETRITDLTTNITTRYNPNGWYLFGGAAPTQPYPTAIRMFAGGQLGNVSAWDNVDVHARPYQTGFENVAASATGTLLTGQDNYILPAGSVDFNAFTYAGNSLNIPANPNGSNQFVAGISQGGTLLARAQRDVSFGCGRGTWTLGADILAKYTGTLPTAQNLASISTQPSTTARALIMLATWVDVNTAAAWNCSMSIYSAANMNSIVVVPDPAFQNLPVDRWYRWETDWDFNTNLMTATRLTDLTTNITATYIPTGWYLLGGAAPTQPAPTAVRIFAGGAAGNLSAWDNVVVAGAVATTRIYGCTNPADSLIGGGTPRIGTNYTVSVHNSLGTQLAPSVPLLLLGLTADPNPCGIPIPGLGMAGGGAAGELLIGNLLPGLTVGPVWTGTPAPITVTIPNDCNLVGASLFVQGVMVGGPGSAVAIALARAAEMRIGEN